MWSEGGEQPVAGSELLCSVRCAAGRKGRREREGKRKEKGKRKGGGKKKDRKRGERKREIDRRISQRRPRTHARRSGMMRRSAVSDARNRKKKEMRP